MKEHPLPTLRLLATSALAGVAALCAARPAFANPTGGQVVGGAATISNSGATLTVTQTTARAILNWSSFDIAAGETTQFVQPSASSIALNRVTDSQSASQIDGLLSANGQVWIINPNGVMFGKNAQVNVAGLLATSSDIDNDRFMAGDYTFSHPGNAKAIISNAGTITAQAAGLVAFVAPTVTNTGVISAQLGKVQLASGATFTVDLYGDGLINLAASPAVTQQIVQNSGTIQANGGQVLLTAAAAENTVNSLINTSGVIQANSISEHNGEIILAAAGATSEADISGTLDASGYGSGETGGTVTVTAHHVALLSGSHIDASGDAGGGTVKSGGDFHGQGTTPTAEATVVQSGASITADALTTGKGGKVAVWANDYTNFAGSISAKGANGDAGGFVETSGHVLDATGMVTAATWLLDPDNLTINGSATTNAGASPSWTAGSGGGNVLNSDIEAALNAGTSVTLTASGQIEFAANIAKTAGGDVTLTASAGTDIIMDSTVGITSTTGKLNIVFDADTALGGGAIVMNSGSAITSNGGAITLGGGADPTTTAAVGEAAHQQGIYLNTSTVDAGGGNILMTGTGYSGSTGYSSSITDTGAGILLNGATVQTSGTGTITLTGTGQGTGASNDGVVLYQNPATISSAAGNLTITGYGSISGSGTSIGIDENSASIIKTTGSGNIILTGVQGTGANSSGFFQDISGTAVQAAGTGSVTINADTITRVTGGSISSNVSVTLKPYTASTTIGFSGGAGTLSVTQAMMDAISAPTVTIGRSDSTGTLTTGAFTWESTLTNLNLLGNSITLGGNITDATASGSLTLKANSDIVQNASITASNSKALNVAFDADADASGAGAIIVNAGMTTNGGDITLGGGADPTTGYAVGDATYNTGINFNAGAGHTTVTLDAGGGNIILNGQGYGGVSGNQGYNGASSNSGIVLSDPYAVTSMLTSGNGTISINGIGGSSTSSGNYGIYSWIYNGSTTIHTGNGTISINGTGSGSGTGSDGIYMQADGGSPADTIDLQSTGGGSITLNGTGAGAGSKGSGVVLTNGNGGTTHLESAGGVTIQSTDSMNISSATIVSSTGSDLTFAANTLSSGSIQTTGTVTLKPYTASTTIGFSGGAGTLSVTQAMMDAISAPTVTIGRSDSTGTLTTGAFTWESTLTNLNLLGNSITLGGNITDSTASGSLTLKANGDISQNTNMGITASNSKTLNVTFDADADASGAGAIVMNSSSSITSNGGNIILGGGANPSVNAASGDSVSPYGIYLNNATINAGAGFIYANGHGYNNAAGDGNYGIYLSGASASMQATDGNISLNGTGGDGGSDNHGIYLTGGARIATTGIGAITVVGTGGAGSGHDNRGVLFDAGTISTVNGGILVLGTGGAGTYDQIGLSIYDGSAMQSSGSGSITLTGNGGSGTHDEEGVALYNNATAAATSGTLSITGSGGSGTTNQGIYFPGGTTTIGGASTTGNITLTTDSFFSTPTSIQTTGTVTLKPHTASTSIGVAGGAGALGITSSFLGSVAAGGITIGSSSDTGAMRLGTYASWNAPVSFVTGSSGSIAVNGAQTTSSGAFTFTGPTTLSANLSAPAGVIVTGNSPFTLGTAATVSAADFSSYSGTLTMSNGLTVNGDVTLGAGMTIAGTGGLTVAASGTLTSNGKIWPNALTLNGGGGTIYTLADDWDVDGSLTLDANNYGAQNLTINGHTIYAGGDLISKNTLGNNGAILGTTAIVLDGTGTWSSGGGTLLENNLTINTAGTITVSGAVQYGTGTLTYTSGTVNTTGSTLNVSGSTTLDTNRINWNNITLAGPDTDTLASDLTVSGNLTLDARNYPANNLTINGHIIYVGGNLVNENTLNNNGAILGTTAIVLDGTGTWSSGSGGTPLENNLTFDTTGAITLSGTINYANGTLSYVAGTLDNTGASLVAPYSLTLPSFLTTWTNITLGSGVQGYAYTIPSGYAIAGNMILQGPNTVTLLGDLNVSGNLTLDARNYAANNLTINGYTIYAGENLVSENTLANNGAILGTTALVLDGTGTWSSGSGGTPLQNNLTIDTPGTITLGGTVNYTTGTLTVAGGTLNLNGNNFQPGGGATFVIDAGGTLELHGGETITTPTLNAGATVKFTGNGDSNPNAYTLTNYFGGNYQNLVIDSADGATDTFQLGSALTVAGNFTNTAGTVDVTASNYGINVAGNWANSGTFHARSSTVTLNGTAAGKTITTGGSDFYNLTINGAGAWTMQDATTVSQALDIAAGTLDGGAQTLTLSGTGTPFTNSGTFTPSTSTVSYTGSGATITGGTYYNLNVQSASDVILPTITAHSIFARTTGTGADVIIPVGATLTASGAGNAITLASGRNFINNAGSGAFLVPSGRWLVYSTAPAQNTLGGLSAAFTTYNCTYGGACGSLPATGDGFLYSLAAPASGVPASTKATILSQMNLAGQPAPTSTKQQPDSGLGRRPGAADELITAEIGMLSPEEWGLKPSNPRRWWERISVRWGE